MMRILSPVPRLPRVGLACLAAVVLFSACGGEADPATETIQHTTSPPPTTAVPPTTTTTLPPTTTAPPSTTTTLPPPTTTAPTTTTAPEASDGVEVLDIGAETTWRDIYGTLTASEKACMGDAVGEDLEWVLQQVVLTEDETRLWDASIYPCLSTPLVEAVFLAGVVYGMELEGMDVGEEQEACLQEVIAEMDGAALLLGIASQVDEPDEAARMERTAQLLELMAGFLRCTPGFDMGDGEDAFLGEDIFSSGWSCPLGTNSDGVDAAARLGLGESVEGVLESDGDAGVFVFGAVEGEFYEVEVGLGSLSDSFVAVCDADGYELAWNDDWVDYPGSRLLWKAPASGDFYVGVSGDGGGSYTLVVEEVAPVEMEGSVEGVLENAEDVAYFVFGAVEGELYEIGVGLGTLSDSIVAVYDADRYEWAWNDNRPDGGLASHLYWKAPASGDFYVGVSGDGGGSYILTAAVSDIVDDHSDLSDGATVVDVGESVEGVLEYPEDVDYFVFGAVEGELYEIDVILGTLFDSGIRVYDADEFQLAWNEDQQDSLASRLVWKAPATGDFYVEVSGDGQGSYTLAVGVSDIVDDYSDGVDGAARVGLGEAVEGVLNYAEDVDVFVFGAVEGELYEIEVGLGTLSDSIVEVYDAEGLELAWNDDQQDSLASHLFWSAPVSGDFYVEVSGFGEGSYTLTVAVSDVVDDYSDQVEGAAMVEVGESVEGVLDYPGDVDYFVFGAVEGVLYEIEVILGTLSDSATEVYDSDGVELAWNDDYGDSLASRIEWRSPAGGDYFIEVWGYGEGSYTLSVEVSE